jgi:hypothetical protein
VPSQRARSSSSWAQKRQLRSSVMICMQNWRFLLRLGESISTALTIEGKDIINSGAYSYKLL